MQIERTDKEIIIRVSTERDLTGLDKIMEYFKFWEIASKSEASEDEIDELSRLSKS